MTNFWRSERGTDTINCENKFAECECNRPVHTEGSCECDCGGMWHYDDTGREVVDQLPLMAENPLLRIALGLFTDTDTDTDNGEDDG